MRNDMIRFSRKQRQVLTWWRQNRWQAIICDGAVRSGKTFCMGLSFFLWAQSCFDGRQFALCGKTVGALRRNLLTELVPCLRRIGMIVRENRSANSLTVEFGGQRNQFLLFGGKDESSAALIQGSTLAGLLLDEAALMPRSFVEQAVARCSVRGSKLWFNCNPEGPHHYIREEFLLKAKEKRVYHLHFTMADNLTLSPSVIQRYERAWPHGSVFYKRFILGQWVAADGLIYQQFADHVQDYLITDEWLIKNQISYAVIGVDFGGTKSAHSFTLTGFTQGYRQVIALDEFYCKKRLNPKQLQDAFVDFVRRAQARFKVYEAYCDSAEPTLIAGLESACMQAHVAIDIKNAVKGQINDRIAFYNSLIAQHRWKIMERCVHIIEAFEQAVYDEKKKNMDIRLDDGLMNVDSLDSTEYSTESVQQDILYIAA